MSSKSNHYNIQYLSLLNVLACYAVVTLHTNGEFWNFSSTEMYWKTANIIESVFYFAVPIFFMLIGATLFDYYERYSTKEFLKKRFSKTLFPFIFWSVVGIVLSGNIFGMSFIDIINDILTAKTVGYFWFFPPLFCVYLCVPLFAATQKDKRQELFSFLVAAGYVFNCLLPFLKELAGINITIPVSVYVCNSYLMHTLIGYLLSKYETNQKQTMVIYTISILALFTHLYGTYYASFNANEVVKTFKNVAISSPYAAGIFLFCKNNGNRIMNTSAGKVISFLRDYTFGIYLTHGFVVKAVEMLGIINAKSLLYRLFSPFAVIPVCVVLIFICRKIPVMRHTVPK